jgi:8-oxo-dGTP pyrophosphatase MutT (NUDIX family)
MTGGNLMGAGVIPFCVHDRQVMFLLHKTFSGRRAGCLVDFGGGAERGENHRQTAIREFIEETESMYFAGDIHTASLTQEQIQVQTLLLESIFDNTLQRHPDWWCPRQDRNNGKPRDWKTFFIQFEYRDVTDINREWARDGGERFSKRRELVWLAADTLSNTLDYAPEKLWKRVRQLVSATEMIRTIAACAR